MASMIGFVSSAIFDSAYAQSPSFDDLIAILQSDPSLVDGIRIKSDNPAEVGLERAPLRAPKSQTAISQRASDLIVACEISNKTLYEARYQSPVWPGGESGITIGIGYDLGYVNPQQLESDWKKYLEVDNIQLLMQACGVTGTAASTILRKIPPQVFIPWSNAVAQFENEVKPRYIGETEQALPNTRQLNADCLGALVSLVYNRGASFNLGGDRYGEMRNIKSLMTKLDFKGIPQEIRDMKHIWEHDPTLRGVVLRREAEAKLFEIGLQSIN